MRAYRLIKIPLILAVIFVFRAGSFAETSTSAATGKPGLAYYQKLAPLVRDEIKITSDESVEVGLGTGKQSVSATVMDAVRSIPLVAKGMEPKMIWVRDKPAYLRSSGIYTYDKKEKHPVRLTTADIRENGVVSIRISATPPPSEPAVADSGHLDRPEKPVEVSPPAGIAENSNLNPPEKPVSPPVAVANTNKLDRPEKTVAVNSPAGIEGDDEAWATTGFRSARFGMSEKEVEQAIARDFPGAVGAITRTAHPVEQTVTLGVTVQDLLPRSGPAQVGYILGHKSQALIQVNVLWGKTVNPKTENATLVAIANELKNYFVRQGFEKDKMVANAALPDGSILVFRGSDKKGHMVALLLGSAQQQKSTEKKEDVDLFLRLSYFENPIAPDIFQIKKGDF